MLDQQLNSYLGSDFWKKISEVTILLALTNKWFWRIKPIDKVYEFSDKYFDSAADAEQDLITFLKNKVV